MRYLILLLLSLSLEARFEDWTQNEQDLFKDFIALNIIDTHITHRNIQDYGAVELNPFIGESPSAERLIMHKVVTTAVLYKLLDNDSHTRERDLKLMNTVLTFVVLHNGYIGFEIRKDF